MTTRRIATAAIAATAIGVLLAGQTYAGEGQFDSYRFEALIDADNDADTGCDVPGADDNFAGPIEGIEYVVQAGVRRRPADAEVAEVDTLVCQGGVLQLGAAISAGEWPVGVNNGIDGADVVEFSVPRDAIGNPAKVTLAFHVTRVFFNDVLLTTDGTESGDPLVVDLSSTTGAPAMSAGGIALLAFLLAVIGWNARRRSSHATSRSAILALIATLATVAWAVTINLDGDVTDWAGIPPLGIDVKDDSNADDDGEDIFAAFVTADAQNVYFRLDQNNLIPVECGNGTLEVTEECETDGHCEMDEDCIACECVED